VNKFEFVPVARPAPTRGRWPDGPICECDRFDCKQTLPATAWPYVQIGQSVLFPGHEGSGRLVEFDGFNVEEADE
jgi:hypothetical protein